ncbi:MAG: DUF86 domain-containing protein [Flavobacteriales bacterium]|nr:DUF86 domain-containing protein [Flavobacteriales bacterium]
MMDPKRKYWSDIVVALDAIDLHLNGVTTFDQYTVSITVKDAVERRLITIGEAVNKLALLEEEGIVEDAQRIRAFRNRLVHSYDSTDDTLVWAIIRNHLSPLRRLAEARSA